MAPAVRRRRDHRRVLDDREERPLAPGEPDPVGPREGAIEAEDEAVGGQWGVPLGGEVAGLECRRVEARRLRRRER